MCAVDQKRPFFLRAGPFLALLPFKEAYEKAGPLREAPYGEGRSLREGPGRGALRSQRKTTKRLTGRLSPYGKPLTGRDGPYGKGRSLRKGPGCLTGPFTKKDDEEARRAEPTLQGQRVAPQDVLLSLGVALRILPDRKEAGFDRNSGRSRFRGVAPLGAARFGHASGCSWPPVKHFGLLEAFCLLEGHASVTL